MSGVRGGRPPEGYQYAPTDRPYTYVLGPLPPVAGDAQGGHRTLRSLTDAETNDFDDLEAMAVAVYRAVHPERGEANSADIPPGFQIRLLRVPTPVYNALVDESNGQEGALKRAETTATEPIAARYVLRLPRGRWQFSKDWEERYQVSFAGAGDPGIGPADDRPGPFRPAVDGQHRLN